MSNSILGKAPESGAKRDAVHVAVIPVKRYNGWPYAGMKVLISDRNSNPMEVEEPMGNEFDGIIDPFLDDNSDADTCWMLVAPNRVASAVRHDWELSEKLADDLEPRDSFCCRGQR